MVRIAQDLCHACDMFASGTVVEYLKSWPDVNKIQILCGIASGLSYIHSKLKNSLEVYDIHNRAGHNPRIVHGALTTVSPFYLISLFLCSILLQVNCPYRRDGIS